MHESSHDDCGCCADVHFGALLNQTSRLIRRALDARINAEVSSELSGVRGMVLGDIVRAERQGRDCHKQIEASIARFEDDLQSGIDPQQAAAARAVLEQTLRNAQHILQEENTNQERGNTNC